MPAYAYQAVDRSGRRERNRAEAESLGALRRTLEGRGLVVLDVSEAEEQGRRPALPTGFQFGRKRAVLEVTRALAALLPAGMPLARALATASNLATPEVARVLGDVRARVEHGESVAGALEEHPMLFPPLYTGLVRAGERSGDLAGAFGRLSGQLEREEALRARLVSASIYPLLLAAAGGLALMVLLLFVLPRFVGLLEGTGVELPRSTALLLALSSAARRFWPALLAVPVGGALLLTWARTTNEGRRAAAKLVLLVPIVRGLRRHALAARLARILGVLLAGGAPLLSALEDAAESLADPMARDEAVRIRARVREGSQLHRAIAEGTLFPPLLAQLVAVGEESGRLGDFVTKAADLFEERTQRLIERLVALAEPAMIIGFGGVVALVALSLLQAIYGVNAGAFR